jgi:toxin secretion/phage lysis holin
MKNLYCAGLGAVGSVISSAFGGWSTGITTLLICMAVDYLTGLICAGIFKKSKKSKNGGLESRVGWKGLCRKGVVLLIVLVAYRLDLLIGTTYIRDAVIIGFCVNELISITENCGLMGVPLPTPIQKAIDILKSKEE